MIILRPVLFLLLASGCSVTTLVPAAEPAVDTNAVWLAEHYTKYEHRIPMRDGVRLFTRVYVPKDDSHAWPIVLTRTPYALKPYGGDNYTDPTGSFRPLAQDSFILVTPDVRRRYRCGGPYVRMGPLANSDKVLLKGRSPEWAEFLAHPTYDAFWQARNLRPHLKNIRCAVMTVGGWYDGEDLFGSLETFRWTERQNPGITNLLVMGPWAHGDWGRKDGDKLGDITFHAKTAEFYRENI